MYDSSPKYSPLSQEGSGTIHINQEEGAEPESLADKRFRSSKASRDYEKQVCWAKVKGGTKVLEHGKVCIEQNSVYGTAILLPQMARTMGWPLDLTVKAIRAQIYLGLSVGVVVILLFYMSKVVHVIDKFSGQMSLCDFGMGLAVQSGPGSLGPGGTNITAPRMYAFTDWVTRNFVRDSLKLIFPDRAEHIQSVVDPGEYGVESYWCRLLCCFVFMLSITQELDNLLTMAQLIWNVPTRNDDWVVLDPDRSREEHDRGFTEPADRWLDDVQIKVAGMSLFWKVWNVVLVFMPKSFVFFLLANTGTTFLMESAGIDDMIINSVALSFLLAIDDLFTSSIQSTSVKYFMEKCEGYALYDPNEGASLGEQEIIQKYGREEEYHPLKLFWVVWPRKLAIVISLTAIFVGKYYIQHCDRVQDRWVSKSMFLPKSVYWNLLNAVFPLFSHPELEKEPYWVYRR